MREQLAGFDRARAMMKKLDPEGLLPEFVPDMAKLVQKTASELPTQAKVDAFAAKLKTWAPSLTGRGMEVARNHIQDMAEELAMSGEDPDDPQSAEAKILVGLIDAANQDMGYVERPKRQAWLNEMLSGI